MIWLSEWILSCCISFRKACAVLRFSRHLGQELGTESPISTPADDFPSVPIQLENDETAEQLPLIHASLLESHAGELFKWGVQPERAVTPGELDDQLPLTVLKDADLPG